MTQKNTPTLADALLQAHVDHVLQQLEAPALASALEDLVRQLWSEAGRLSLDELVDRRQVQRSARHLLMDLEQGEGLRELVADIARRVFDDPALAQTNAGALVAPATVEAIIDEVLALQGLRERLVRVLIDTPVYARFASELLYNGIKDYLAQNALTDSIPGARSMMKLGKAVMSRATPKLEASVEEGLKRYIARSIGPVSQRSVEPLLNADNNESLRAAALDLWTQFKGRPLGELREFLRSEDIARHADLGWRAWQTLRHTELLPALVATGIDSFFDRYGRQPLTALLQDLGIDAALLQRELMHYLPGVLKTLRRKKRLEPLVRQQLEPFYRSETVTRLLAGAQGGAGP